MKITNVVTKAYESYILLAGWDSVAGALNTFAAGYSRGSGATHQVTKRDIAASNGPAGVGLFTLTVENMNQGGFVDHLLQEAEPAVSRNGRWSGSYDYDAMGTPFFKSNVDILKLDEILLDNGKSDILYGLGISAAYVGNEPEIRLAEYLGLSRALMWASVEVETEPVEGNRFEFDFDDIVHRLNDASLGEHWVMTMKALDVTGENIAKQMIMAKDAYDDGKHPAVHHLYLEPGLAVYISPGAVKSRFDFEDPFGPGRQEIDTWKANGSVLTGLQRESYEKEGELAPPTFQIVLSDRKNWRNEPIWRPDRKARTIFIRDVIASVFQN